jgi:hypothetical protein
VADTLTILVGLAQSLAVRTFIPLGRVWVSDFCVEQRSILCVTTGFVPHKSQTPKRGLSSPPPQDQIEIGERELAWNTLPFNRIVLLKTIFLVVVLKVGAPLVL